MPVLLALATVASTICPGLSVHDGDTVRCGQERIRIANIDAPELPGSPRCGARRGRTAWCDFETGFRARDALRVFLAGGPASIERQGRDVYGRTLATVSVNGMDAGRYLIRHGLARAWR